MDGIALQHSVTHTLRAERGNRQRYSENLSFVAIRMATLRFCPYALPFLIINSVENA